MEAQRTGGVRRDFPGIRQFQFAGGAREVLLLGGYPRQTGAGGFDLTALALSGKAAVGSGHTIKNVMQFSVGAGRMAYPLR